MISLATSRPARIAGIGSAPAVVAEEAADSFPVAVRLPVQIVLAVLVRVDHGHELQVLAGYHSGIHLSLRLSTATHLREQNHVARCDVATATEHTPGDNGQRGGGCQIAEEFAAIDVVHCSILAQRRGPRSAAIMDQRCDRRRMERQASMTHETAFEMAASNIRFGVGVTREVGMDLADIGAKRVLVVTDPVVRGLAPFSAVVESLEQSGIHCDVYDRVRVEPTDGSMRDAIAFAATATLRRDRRRGRRIDHRHRQGREPLHVLSSCRLSRLRQCADRQGPPCTRPFEATDGGSDDGRYRERDNGSRDLRSGTASRQDRNRQSPAQAHPGLSRSRQHTNDAAARLPPRRGWTFCVMRWSRIRRCRFTREADRIVRR